MKMPDQNSRYLGLLTLVGINLIVYTIFKVIRPDNFGNPENIFSYFQQALMPSVAACGLYFIVVMGLFDFSIGSIIVLTGLTGVLAGSRFGYAGFVIFTILLASILGLINGGIYIRFRIPSIIVTIGTMIIYECIGALMASGQVFLLSDKLGAFGHAPMNLLLAGTAFIFAYYIMNFTKVGIYTNAIGSNEKAACDLGINVRKYKIIAFVLAGTFSGIMSILTVSYGNAISPETNMASMSRSFTPLMGCFFALAFRKITHPILSIIAGEMIIMMLMNGLIAVGVPSTMQNVIIGITLIVIIILTTHSDKDAVVK